VPSVLKETIMSKTNETSNLVALTDSELDAVTGGMLFLNPSPSMSMAEICLEAVKLGLTDCIQGLGNMGVPPKA
jgi:hypothetical protein